MPRAQLALSVVMLLEFFVAAIALHRVRAGGGIALTQKTTPKPAKAKIASEKVPGLPTLAPEKVPVKLKLASEKVRVLPKKTSGVGRTEEDPDSLTVMSFNTFLTDVSVFGIRLIGKPALGARAAGIQKWFLSLRPEDVPDVVVLQEIFSGPGHDVVRTLCSKDWSADAREAVRCTETSLFQAATGEACSTSEWNPLKGGGVVVLTRRGLTIDPSTADECFQDYAGWDHLAYKGFWVVRLRKESRPYVVVGTNLQTYKDRASAMIRGEQLKAMRRHIDQKLESGARVVIAGDMNVFLYPYEGANEVYPNESAKDFQPEERGMQAALGWQSKGRKLAEAGTGEHVPQGFWLPLDREVLLSVDSSKNHYRFHDESKTGLGSQMFDWVLAPGEGDRLASPTNMRFQVVPVKADSCFVSGLAQGKQTDDLSDHYAVFAQICYQAGGGPCAKEWLDPVKEHRGTGRHFPSGSPDCAAIIEHEQLESVGPGRDWMVCVDLRILLGSLCSVFAALVCACRSRKSDELEASA